MVDQVLPPGLSAARFADALKEFRQILGAEHVLAGVDETVSYRKIMVAVPDMDLAPSGALMPSTVEEIQRLLKVCNRYRIPLWTISTGKNFGYGSASPATRGQMVLDLRRMNRIIEVDPVLGTALVEPGVTYRQLRDYLDEKGYNFWIDVPSPSAIVGPVGNTLERGVGYTPYGDHFMMSCGMEVVMADGQVLRTGMGGVENSGSWQCFKWGYGPYLDGIFSQSNFGIVTKMGFWLMPEPEASMSGRIRVRRHDDVIPFVRTLASLMYSNIVNCNFTVQSPAFLSAPNPEKARLLAKADGGSAQEWDNYAASLGLDHFWETELRFYGPPKIMAAQWDYVKERFSSIGGVRFDEGATTHFPLTDTQIGQLSDVTAFGIPSLSAFSGLAMGALSGGRAGLQTRGHLDASPIVPISGEALLKAQRVFNKVFQEAGLPQGLGFAFNYHWRTFIVFQGMEVTNDREHNAKIRAAYEKCAQVAADNGWGLYRAHAAFHDQVMRLSSFNDHALMRLHETLKDALDPNGILSAGRYGIWPKHLRAGRV